MGQSVEIVNKFYGYTCYLSSKLFVLIFIKAL